MYTHLCYGPTFGPCPRTFDMPCFGGDDHITYSITSVYIGRYIYIYMCVYIYMYVCVYIYTYKRTSAAGRPSAPALARSTCRASAAAAATAALKVAVGTICAAALRPALLPAPVLVVASKTSMSSRERCLVLCEHEGLVFFFLKVLRVCLRLVEIRLWSRRRRACRHERDAWFAASTWD